MARGRQSLAENGVQLERVIVHYDQDPDFTGYGWTARLMYKNRVQMSMS